MPNSNIENSHTDAKDSKETYTKPILQKLNTESNEGKAQQSPFEVPPTPGGAQTIGS